MPNTTTAPTSGLPGVYAQEMATPASPPRVPGDVAGFIFEGSRGIPHLPAWLRDADDFTRKFGGRTPTQADATKLLSGYTTYYALDQQGVQDTLGVRVGTTKMRTARMTIQSGANSVLDLWASSPGTWANGNLTVTIAAGQAQNTWDMTVTNAATGEVDTINGLPMADNAGAINQINATANLVYATQPVVPAPTAAPTFSATTGTGTVAANPYYLQFVWVTASGGKSQASPEATVTLSATGKLTVTVPAAPTGVTSWRYYIATASGQETYAGSSTTFNAPVDITAPWAASAERPPWGPIDQTGALIASTSGAGYTAAIPTAGTYTFAATGASPTATLAPGDNGEGATAAQAVGDSTLGTGIYAFANMDQDEQPLYITLAEGLGTDSTQWATLAQYGFANNCQIVVSFPQGTSAATAQTSWATFTATLTPAVAKHIKLAWPWATIYDTTYARDLFVSSAPYLAAMGAITPANTSAANKPVAGLSGVEYVLTTDSAAQSLVQAGVNPLSGRITQKGVGFLSDFMGDGSYGYESRMKAELIRRMTPALAWASDIPNDAPNRDRVEQTAINVFRGMVTDGILEDNPPTTSTVATTAVTTSTTGKKAANSAVGTQPSTVAAVTTPTFYHWACECDSANNLDDNGVPLGPYFILDLQMQVTRNADAVWLRYSAGVFQVITIGVPSTTAAA